MEPSNTEVPASPTDTGAATVEQPPTTDDTSASPTSDAPPVVAPVPTTSPAATTSEAPFEEPSVTDAPAEQPSTTAAPEQQPSASEVPIQQPSVPTTVVETAPTTTDGSIEQPSASVTYEEPATPSSTSDSQQPASPVPVPSPTASGSDDSPSANVPSTSPAETQLPDQPATTPATEPSSGAESPASPPASSGAATTMPPNPAASGTVDPVEFSTVFTVINGSSSAVFVPVPVPTTSSGAVSTPASPVASAGSSAADSITEPSAAPSPSGDSSSSADVTASSSGPASSSTNDDYAWVPTSTLLINKATSTSYDAAASPTSAPETLGGASTSMVDGKPSVTITSQAPWPSQLPSRIVPATEDDSTQPAEARTASDSTIISILLSDAMPWTWVVSSSDASGQIIYYMPLVISQALAIPADQVKTVALQAYQSTAYSDSSVATAESTILTVYLASIPTSLVAELDAMLQALNSPLYNQPGIQGQLAAQFIPSFAVTSYATELKTNSAFAQDSQIGLGGADGGADGDSSGSDNSTKIVIGVVVSGGVILLAIAGYFAFRATKRGAIALRRDTDGRTGSPRMDDHPALRQFQLGGGRTQFRDFDRDSISTTSTASTGYSDERFGGRHHQSPAQQYRQQHSTSVDMAGTGGSRGSGSAGHDRRSSWWRFSGASGSGSSGSGGHVGSDMREGPRRINIVRGPNGHIDSSQIGR